jgi:hypothetical protein
MRDPSPFTGIVNRVQLNRGTDDQSDLISPEDRLGVDPVRR